MTASLRLEAAALGRQEAFTRQQFGVRWLHRDHPQTLMAAAGMRPASSGPLFLEHYLEEPLESAISRLAGVTLGRERMVEVGNLASLSAGSARIMITTVTWLLATRGLRWVAFTGASTLINSFQRLGLVPTVVAQADPARLNETAQCWGHYYAQHPHVYVGDRWRAAGAYTERPQPRGAAERAGFLRLCQWRQAMACLRVAGTGAALGDLGGRATTCAWT